MKKLLSNEKGLTLIELLASITILSIVILTFLAFFTNAFRFNAINSDAIQAMNIAREQQALIKKDANIAQLLEGMETQYYIQEKDDRDYHIKISIATEPESSNTYHELHLAHVEIYRENKLLSETYTYYEGNVRDN